MQKHLTTWHFCGLLIAVASISCAHVSAAEPHGELAFRPRPMHLKTEMVPLPESEPSLRSPVVSLDELQQIALQRNPSLAEAGAQVAAAQGRWLQVGLPPNPQLGYLGTEIGNDGRAGQQGLFVEQQFIRGGKLQLNRRAAQADIARQTWELNVQRLRVLTEVRQGYYDVQVADRTRQFTSRLLVIGNDAVDTVQALMAAHEASRVTLLQAEVEAEQAQIAHANAENRYAAAWRSLAAVIGEPAWQPQPLVDDLEQISAPRGWDETLQLVLTSSPELAAARARVQQASWEVSRARAEPIPDLFVQGTAQYDHATQDAMGGAQIGLPIPLLNRNQGGISAAQGELAAARAAVARQELQLQQRLAVVYERYVNSLQQVNRYQQTLLPRADESLELISTGYRAGEFDYLTMLTAQRTFAHVHLAYLESLRELQNSTAEIDGLLLTNSLAAPEGGTR